MTKCCKLVTCSLLALAFIVLRPFVLFIMYMIFDPGGINSCNDCKSDEYNSVLPLRIHQVFYNITHADLPPEIIDAQQSWPILNKEFKYTLWNETMVETLLHEYYSYLEDLYFSYDRWIHKVDMARYLIIHQYGGIYADIDIECKADMLKFYTSLPASTGVVMYYTSPFGVSNDFIIAKPKHPFTTSVIKGLKSSYRWYVLPFFTEMFSTGPIYLSARFWSFKKRYDMIVLQETRSFLRHKSGASWHEADSKVLWWLFLNTEIVIQWVFTCFGAIILVYIALKLIKKRSR